jgi:hypothetical protein
MTMTYKKACIVLEEFTNRLDKSNLGMLPITPLSEAIALLAEAFQEQQRAAGALADLHREPPQITNAVRECVDILRRRVDDSPGMEKQLARAAQRSESRKIALGFGFMALVLALYALWILYRQGISDGQLKMIMVWSWIPVLPWFFILSGGRRSESTLTRFHRFQSFEENRGTTFSEWVKNYGGH